MTMACRRDAGLLHRLDDVARVAVGELHAVGDDRHDDRAGRFAPPQPGAISMMRVEQRHAARAIANSRPAASSSRAAFVV